jgi:glycosyltransferase involved in cell wall biosynthesis
LNAVTPLILTYDEAPNIGRVLDRLAWAGRIVVVDSGSTDETLEIVARYPQVEVFFRPFDSFARQCNFGMAQIESEWVLSLDADYVLSEALAEEIRSLPEDPEVSGYRARFVYCIEGRPLRGTLYPPRTVLYRRTRARYEDDGHGHLVRVEGVVRDLRSPIFHDDRKPLARWLRSQDRYADLEAEKLLTTPADRLGRVDRLRRLGWLVPFLTPAYCLLARGLILDGRAGLHYTFQRTYAELLLALKLLDRRLRRASGDGPPLGSTRNGAAEPAELPIGRRPPL